MSVTTSDNTAGRELQQRLRQANREEVLRLLRAQETQLDPACARQCLRNPFVCETSIGLLARNKDLIKNYEVRRDLVLHPKTSEVLARNWVGTLRWRDLVRVSANVRVAPKVRRQADQQLRDRLPGLALGEKIAVARIGGTTVLERLRRDSHPMVVSAVLSNPRATEGLILPVAGSEGTPREVLRLIARDPKWGTRYSLRLALAKNVKAPQNVVIAILPGLKRHDLRGIVSDRRLPRWLRDRADALIEGTGRRP